MSDFFVIPKKVFEDTKLNDFAKLVFAKLLDLSTEDLCCTITNRELAEEFAKSQSTIKRAIVSLQKAGYVNTKVDYPKYGEINRNIFLLIDNCGNKTHWGKVSM